MEKEVLVKVQNVSKKFCYDLKTSLKYGAADIVKSTLGFKTNKELREKEFWAVHDVSFELRRGECIGLIGHNGAGKSTLLKVLNGLYAPDKGQITMHGKIGALIELGAGFNPILTGRENIYNNAAILGFTREEVEAKMDSIIAFSEIEKFLDTPVKNYSSGMKVRLGFAVAAHLEPDILIIDEVLAVGDLGFILKCFKKIDELLPNTAVIFVSHSMQMISRICNQIILMNHGKVMYQGNVVSKGIDMYYNMFSTNGANIVFDDKSYQFLKITDNLENNTLSRNKDLKVTIHFKHLGSKNQHLPKLYLEIKDKDMRPIAGVVYEGRIGKELNKEFLEYQFTIKNSLFTLGKYTIDLTLKDFETESPLMRINNFFSFNCDGNKSLWVPIMLESEIETIQHINFTQKDD